MSRKLIVSPLAESDIRTARDWSESKRSGLGRKFRTALKSHLQEIQIRPESFPIFYQGVRRLKMRGYPHYIYYRVLDEYIEIITVFHPSRKPEDLDDALAE